jgi:hypothetical protein
MVIRHTEALFLLTLYTFYGPVYLISYIFIHLVHPQILKKLPPLKQTYKSFQQAINCILITDLCTFQDETESSPP